MGYKNLNVLKGGINTWFNTIINPKVPTENMASSEFELYTFRKAASMYFGVAYPDKINKNSTIVKRSSASKASNIAAPKKVIVTKKKKKMPVEGGC